MCGNCVPSGRIFRPSVAIRNPRNIAPPSPMKIFAGLKFQRRNPSEAPSAAAPRVRTSVCPFMAAEMVKKRRGHRGDPGAEAVHVVKNAERGRDPHHPDDREAPVEDQSGHAGHELRKKLRADAGSDQENRGKRHADEEFHLMMEQPAVVEEPDDSEQSGSGENAYNLLLGYAVAREQNRQHKSEIHGDAAEQRDGAYMNFARPGLIHHAVAQRQMPHRHRKSQRSQKRHCEGDDFGVIGE